jgi:hypothetical protein
MKKCSTVLTIREMLTKSTVTTTSLQKNDCHQKDKNQEWRKENSHALLKGM